MSFAIPITHKIEKINLKKGVFIFLHRASKVPPHIGLIVNGKLFEISTNGPEYDLSGSAMLQTAQKRGVEVIFVELKTPNLSTTEDTSLRQLTEVGGVISVKDPELLITHLVKHYFKVSDEVSCLNPIKDFIQAIYQIDVNKADFIFELLPILYDKKLVKSVVDGIFDQIVLLDTLYDCPFEYMPLDGSFGQFYGDMTRKLVVFDPWILFDIEKSEQSLAEVLPFPGDEDNILST